jgi:hypothetical protein
MKGVYIDKEIYFSEKQKFKQWWLWLILFSVNGLFIFDIYNQLLSVEQFGDESMSNIGMMLAAGLMLLLTIMFFLLRLETQIKKDGIYLRFFPFHLSFRHYNWDKISKSFVRQYNPVGEFGGWGIRFGFIGKGKAFNVSGNKGLQLEFSDKSKLLIGTNKPDELTETLKKLNHLNSE